MRTSGGRGADAWLIAIPLLALLVAASFSAGGLDAALLTLNTAVRDAISAVMEFVRRLF